MKIPNRYDKLSTHVLYGIHNWLRGIGITDTKVIAELIHEFAQSQGFVPQGKGKRHDIKVMNVFVSNRFNAFMEYVLKNTEIINSYDKNI